MTFPVDILGPMAVVAWVGFSVLLLILGFAVGYAWTIVRKLTFAAKASAPVPLDLAAVSGIDLIALDAASMRLKEMGFRHLLDYELAHVNREDSREVYRSFVSPDAKTIATLEHEFSDVSGLNSCEFVSWFASGRSLTSTNARTPTPNIDPMESTRIWPGSRDFPRMLRVPENAVVPWLIGAALGGYYGWQLWMNGVSWSIFVPSALVYGAWSNPDLLAPAACAGLGGFIAGFFASGGRGAWRGQAAIRRPEAEDADSGLHPGEVQSHPSDEE